MAIYCTEHERATYEDIEGWRPLPIIVPSAAFKIRVFDDDVDSFVWQTINTFDLFANRRVLLFSLPGAFTPTCSTYQLPTFEQMAVDFYEEGIEDIYCFTVNDAFVCNAWAKANNLEEIKVIPDGTGKFTEEMQMLVNKDNLGFGNRSWRYACVVDNGTITDWFIEEGKEDNHEKDPYLYTNPEYILNALLNGN